MRRNLVLLIWWLLLPLLTVGQTRIAIRAARLIDGKSEKPLENVLLIKAHLIDLTVHGC